MKRLNRNTFIDTKLQQFDNGKKYINIYPEWMDGHILIDSRMNWDDFDGIKKYLDDMKIVYKVLTGHDNAINFYTKESEPREYYGIYIMNSNFRNAEFLASDF